MKKFYLCAVLLLMAATTQAQNQMSATADKYRLTINYFLAGDTTPVADPYEEKLEEGTPYCVASPVINNYKPDRDTVKGTMPAQDTTETVYYIRMYMVTTESSPTTGGTTGGGDTYPEGHICTVTATANTGFSFTNWTENDSVVSTDSIYTFTVTRDHNLVAKFSPQQYTITVSANPNNGGTVSGGDTYNHGQSCTVTATVNTGFNFTNWTENGSVVSTEASYTFDVTSNRNLVANFTTQSQTYTITVSANPSNGGTVTGGDTYNQGQSCTVTATANTDFSFTNWTENGSVVSTNASYTFNVTGNRTLVANFTQTYTVTVDSLITNGTVSVSPSVGVVEGTPVTITATPHEGYVLDTLKAYNKSNPAQTVEIEDFVFTMPAFDVEVTAVFELAGNPPVIDGDIEAPAAICAGGVLDLTAPSVNNASTEEWQMSPDSLFETVEVYRGQPLDASYNGWKLRYMASNDYDTVYSNVVDIIIRDLSQFVLTGDQNICSGQECIYRVRSIAGVGVGVGLTCTWSVTDPHAIVEPSGSSVKVLWGSKGTHQVKALIEENESGCSESFALQVNVQSYIDGSDVQDIVAKKHDGKAYLLIYPNPKDTYKYQWYKDGTAIAGANGQYYYPTGGLADGDYQVYISFNADAQGNLFCGAFSAVFTVSERNVVFGIYPNPGKTGEQLVVVNQGKEAEVSVYTLDGKLVYHQVIAHGTQPIGVVLPQGLYVVHFNDGENLKSERIVIQ